MTDSPSQKVHAAAETSKSHGPGSGTKELCEDRIEPAQVSLNDWMGTLLRDDHTLRDAVMPGSHDAGMYMARPNLNVFNSKSQVITQFVTIRRQLELGTRFFDVRIYQDDHAKGKPFRTGHFASKKRSSMAGLKLGNYGADLEDVLKDLKSFLQDNPSEVVIIKINVSDNALKGEGNAFSKIKEELGDLLFKSKDPVNLATVKLGEGLRGKVLAVFDIPEGNRARALTEKVHEGDFHEVSKDTPVARESPQHSILWLRGDAPKKPKLEVVHRTQRDARRNRKEVLEPHLTMYYLTVTVPLRSVVKRTAKDFGLRLRKGAPSSWAPKPSPTEAYAREVKRAEENNGGAPNIIMFDFVNQEGNAVVINRNLGKSAT